MKAIKFKQANKVLKGEGCYDLHAHYDKETITFCWKLSFRERLKILFTGKIWHFVWSRNCIIQPVAMEVNCPFKDKEDKSNG